MTWRHVFDDLAAYAEGQLDRAHHERVSKHLASCADCRASLEQIRRGIALVGELSAEPMPTAVADRIRDLLASGRIPQAAGTPRSHLWRAAALLAMTLAGIGLYWQMNRPWIRLQAARAAPTAFEAAGRLLHDRLVRGEERVMFRASDEGAIWRWLGEQQAPVTSLMAVREASDRARFVPAGALVRDVNGARTSVLSYTIDGRPVTLSLALSRQVADAPAPGWWSKRVIHRRDARGVNTLTWTVGGGTYVLVSELDGSGQQACLICHTSPRFKQRILDLRQ